MKVLILKFASLMAVSSLASLACGESFPTKPIRIITGEPAGSTDFAARLVAQGMSTDIGQNVIVENRPSNLIGDLVAKAQPDGYTLLVAGGTFIMGPLLQKTAYDPVRDFSAVTMITNSPSVLVVHPSVPAKSVKDLVALAKSRPGKLNYASGNTGSANHLAAELFKSMAGVDIVRIPYKGQGQATTDVAGGQVQMMFGGAGNVLPHIKSGRLLALGVTTIKPSALFPGVPTIAASGVPGYESGSMQGLWTPAGTPAMVIRKLNVHAGQYLGRQDVKEKLLITGVEAAPTSPDRFGAIVKTEMVKIGKLIQNAGIRAD